MNHGGDQAYVLYSLARRASNSNMFPPIVHEGDAPLAGNACNRLYSLNLLDVAKFAATASTCIPSLPWIRALLSVTDLAIS